MEHLDFLMNSVYCYAANLNQKRNEDDSPDEHRLSPPILLVGTHRHGFANSQRKTLVGILSLLLIISLSAF